MKGAFQECFDESIGTIICYKPSFQGVKTISAPSMETSRAGYYSSIWEENSYKLFRIFCSYPSQVKIIEVHKFDKFNFKIT